MMISKSAADIGRLFGRFAGRLPGVLPTVASSLVVLAALSPAAHAVPTLSPFANTTIPVTSAGLYINVVTGLSAVTPGAATGWDINPWGTGSNFMYAAATGGIVSSTLSPFAALTVGTTVGPASTYVVSPGAASFGTGAGQWTLNATNYFGFRFIGEDTLLHYGYGTMTVFGTPTARRIDNIWYESVANTAITVAAVPEASTTAMLLLGGAFVAGLGLRRQRQAA